MMKKQIATLILVLFAINLLYANCGSFKTATLLAGSATALCTEKMRATSISTWPRSVCAAENFVCERRVFRPGVTNGQTEENSCANINGASKCVQVRVYSFNTDVAREGSEPADYAEGGQYNREDIQCTNSQALNGGVAMIQSDGSSLEEALSKTIQKCEERTTP